MRDDIYGTGATTRKKSGRPTGRLKLTAGGTKVKPTAKSTKAKTATKDAQKVAGFYGGSMSASGKREMGSPDTMAARGRTRTRQTVKAMYKAGMVPTSAKPSVKSRKK